MRKKDYKGRCEKRTIIKAEGVCKFYDVLQMKYADLLQEQDDITIIRCNVVLEGVLENGYMSDIVCKKSDGSLMVRECVYRKHLTKPMTIDLLDESKRYWEERGVRDWGIVIDEE